MGGCVMEVNYSAFHLLYIYIFCTLSSPLLPLPVLAHSLMQSMPLGALPFTWPATTART